MSTDYYLDCKTCNEAVHITDNKANPPIDEELLKIFLVYHGYRHSQAKPCQVVLESEHTIEYDHIIKFKKTYAENERKEKGENHGKTRQTKDS